MSGSRATRAVVETCPSCSARLDEGNVGVLADGSCSACGAIVSSGADRLLRADLAPELLADEPLRVVHVSEAGDRRGVYLGTGADGFGRLRFDGGRGLWLNPPSHGVLLDLSAPLTAARIARVVARRFFVHIPEGATLEWATAEVDQPRGRGGPALWLRARFRLPDGDAEVVAARFHHADPSHVGAYVRVNADPAVALRIVAEHVLACGEVPRG